MKIFICKLFHRASWIKYVQPTSLGRPVIYYQCNKCELKHKS